MRQAERGSLCTSERSFKLFPPRCIELIPCALIKHVLWPREHLRFFNIPPAHPSLHYHFIIIDEQSKEMHRYNESLLVLLPFHFSVVSGVFRSLFPSLCPPLSPLKHVTRTRFICVGPVSRPLRARSLSPKTGSGGRRDGWGDGQQRAFVFNC